jgi:hypothetical protein
MALDGKTPADLAGIEIRGNKWRVLIQNASNKKYPKPLQEKEA